MPARLPEALLRWSRDASGLGLVRAVLGPGEDPYPQARGFLDQLFRRLVRAVLGPAFPSGPPPAGAASTAVVDQAWLIASALDSGPAMRAGTHPARFALSLYDGHADWASGLADLEREQGEDATTRLLGLAAIAHLLFGGSPESAAAAFHDHPVGGALLRWWAAVEVALAFSQDGELPVDHVPSELVFSAADHADTQLSALADRATLEAATTILRGWMRGVEDSARGDAGIAGEIAAGVRAALPALAEASRDALQEEAATFGVYAPMLARLIAEVAPDTGAIAAAQQNAAAQQERDREAEAARQAELAERAAANRRAEEAKIEAERLRLAALASETISALERARAEVDATHREIIVAEADVQQLETRLGPVLGSLSALAPRRSQARAALSSAFTAREEAVAARSETLLNLDQLPSHAPPAEVKALSEARAALAGAVVEVQASEAALAAGLVALGEAQAEAVAVVRTNRGKDAWLQRAVAGSRPPLWSGPAPSGLRCRTRSVPRLKWPNPAAPRSMRPRVKPLRQRRRGTR